MRAPYLITLFASYCLAVNTIFAGSLEPPAGAPEPTMKTLDEIEPRTPIHDLESLGGTILIDAPGNYYLAEGLSNADALRIENDGVTLDLGGFSHQLSQGVEVVVPEGSEVVIRNGSLTNESTVTMDGDFHLKLKAVTFHGGSIQIQFGAQLSVIECRFLGDGNGFAIYGSHCDFIIRESVFRDYNEAIAINGLQDDESLKLSGSSFRGNVAALIVSGSGSVEVDRCSFDGANEFKAQQPRAFEFQGLSGVGFVDCSFRNYELVFDVPDSETRLRVEKCVFERFRAVLTTTASALLPVPHLFRSCDFKGDVTQSLIIEAYNEFVSIDFINSTFEGFSAIGLSQENCRLRFDRCQFGRFGGYNWPHGTQVSRSTLRFWDELTGSFSSGRNSHFLRTKFVGDLAYSLPLEFEEGAVLASCHLSGLWDGIRVLHHSVVLRDTSVVYASSSGDLGNTAVENLDSDESKAVLLEGTTISGYQTGLIGGNFQAHRLAINGCEKAFDSIPNLQLSESTVFASDLGEVHQTAVLTGSNLRASGFGLWVGRAQILNCSFTNQGARSDRGLEIGGFLDDGGTVKSSSFSGFATGIYAVERVGILDSTFNNCDEAIRISAPNSVIMKNMVVGCQSGISVGSGATVVENTVSVDANGISGDGLIVKNIVMVSGGSPYNLGAGTIGRILTGDAINPKPTSTSDDAGEPWANVWESF